MRADPRRALALRDMIDRLVAPILAVRPGSALAVGVVEQGRRCVHGYGRIGEDRDFPPGADTLFEIGSVTKVFTATLLATLVRDGLVRLADPVRSFLPELSQMPDGITLLRLATHTSGLPRLPPNLLSSSVKDLNNPYSAYTVRDLLAYLATYDRPPADDEPWVYSNLGAGLLGHALSRRAGSPYEALVVRRVCDPLLLADTRIALTDDQRARLAEPRSAYDAKASPWDLPALPGAGALRSTPRDLLAFVAANLGCPSGSLGPALRDCQAVTVAARPPPDSSGAPDTATLLHMALGWIVSRVDGLEPPVFWHDGGTGGYRSFVGFVKERDVGVVVLSNVGASVYDRSVHTLGMGILQILSSRRPSQEPRS